MSKFASRLISLRKEAGLTQTDLSKVVDLKRSTISGYEIEGKEPNLDTICLLAKYFGVTTDYLLGYSDEKTNTESVFYNDRVNFERNFKAMPTELRPTVAKCFDSFYLLLNRDMQLARPERLEIYQDLLQTLQSLRAEIRKAVETSAGSSDPTALSNLMATQAQLKNEVSALLDKLIQADMEIAFNLKKSSESDYSRKSAM